MKPLPVLIVDDDEEDFLLARDVLSDIAGEVRYSAHWARTPEEALEKMVPSSGQEPDHVLCLLDYRLGPVSGIALLRQARESGYCRPVLLLTGSDDRAIDQEALTVGASDYLVKGQVTPELLERSIRYAIAQKETEAQLRATAQALSEARRREADVGAAIQRTLLLRQGPSRPPRGFSLGVYIQGAERVTGDYCDFLTFREQSFDVILGDVMGKGMAAALVGAGVKSQLQVVVRRLTAELHPFGRLPEPQEILGGLQAMLTPVLNDLDCFVTMTYARFAYDEQRLYFVDAGHPSILHWHAQAREFEFLRGDNVPLGIVADEFYQQHCVSFQPGDLFVLYSDGLVEAQNPEGEEFGEARLQANLAQSLEHQRTPQEMSDTLCESINLWREGKGDDLTCVVVRIDAARERPPEPALRKAREFASDPEELESLRQIVEEFCLSCGAQERLDHILLGLSEAAGNIIKHAYKQHTGERFRFEASAFTDHLLFCLHDRGKKFDFEAVLPPMLDGTSDGGFGWFLIQSCFDEIIYYRDELGWNHLQLKIKNYGNN